MEIKIINLSKSFQNVLLLDNINLDIHSGELIALLGPSGSGKTTLLRIIAGLEFADAGSLLMSGKEVQTKHVRERNIGFVFQHYALFKHMTVFENVAFGLKVRPKHIRRSKLEIEKKVMDLLELVHLKQFYDYYPYQLSGGQRQRVSLVRSLAVDPAVLLLDEPFGALDTKVRKELRRWLRKLHDEMHITTILVTHDQEEALEVADRIVIMKQGKFIQVGTPEEVWYYPINEFTYSFLGNFNEFDAWKDEEGNIFFNVANKPANSKAIKLYARPHHICVTKSPEASDDFEYIKEKVININLTGPLVSLELQTGKSKIIKAEIPQVVFEKLLIKRGDVLFIRPTNTKAFE